MDLLVLTGIFPIKIEDNVWRVLYNAKIVPNPCLIVVNVLKIG